MKKYNIGDKEKHFMVEDNNPMKDTFEMTTRQRVEQWFEEWQGELIGEQPAKALLLNIIDNHGIQ